MIRKLVIALGATAVLGVAALAPTAASAGGWHKHYWHGHHGWHRGIGFYGPTFIAAPDCYVVKRVIRTPYGPRLRRVTVCN
jgi:hypothetical protein